VYLHRAKQYLVTEMDLTRRNVFVEPAKLGYYTRALVEKTTEIIGAPLRSQIFPGFVVREGRLKVTARVVAYEKRRTSGQILIDVVELDLPPMRFETIGIWIEIPDEVKRTIENSPRHFMGGIHALEHAAISMFPLFAMCDRDDIGGISTPQHEQVCKAAVFIYDGHSGGVGLSRRAFDVIEDLLRATLALVEGCPCETGCPSCIHSPKCGSGNKPLDKEACVRVLTLLFNPEAKAEVVRRRGGETTRLGLPGTPARIASDAVQIPNPSGFIKPAETIPVEVEARKTPSVSTRIDDPIAAEPPRKTALTRRPKAATALLAPKTETDDPPHDIADRIHGRVVVFDLETQRLAQDVGGWSHIRDMGISIAVTHCEGEGFRTFFEDDVDDLVRLLVSADLVVGYNQLRFDYEVLTAYTDEDLRKLPNLDMLKYVEAVLGYRLKLDQLAAGTLGRSKTGNGLIAPEWFREGKFDLLEQYCREDVNITRDLFRFGNEHGYLLFQGRGRGLKKVEVRWAEKAAPTRATR
jgi:DEAD/DEAH box helicase domain-containing protein